MAASPIIAPEEEGTALEEKTRKTSQPELKSKPVNPKQQVQDTLFEIFEGHEDFLGWTPD
ncbi:MAG: hypothetical protein WB799_03680 [Candidatus Sulfotelmatobacter sp.]